MSTVARADVAIIGAGIVGLAHAYAAARRGLRVIVLERDAAPHGASIRNFGLCWLIGQPIGPLLDRARYGRRVWLDLGERFDFRVRTAGSLHIAHHDDELQVMREFAAAAAAHGYDVDVLTRDQLSRHSAAIRIDETRGGLFSRTELLLNSPRAIVRIVAGLAREFGVEFRFNEHASQIDSGVVRTSAGDVIEAARIFICGGDELATLFPAELRAAGVERCRLRMAATGAQPPGFSCGPAIATGLSLRHYRSFEHCPSLPIVRARIAAEQPELDRWGIHLLAVQNDANEILLGDSHEYGREFEPWEDAEIDATIQRLARRTLDLPNWRIERRWTGYYATRTGDSRTEFTCSPRPGVTLVTAVGGAGMTTAFGLAEEHFGGAFLRSHQ